MHRAPVVSLIVLAFIATACAGSSPSPSAPALSSPVSATPAPSSPVPSLVATASPSSSAEVLPGESWIAFQTSGANGYGVYLMREDGTGMHWWPSGILGGGEHPDWSPDGERIMVNSLELDGTEDVWSAKVDGTDAVRHVDCIAPCVWADEAAWSPDGKKIAFQRLIVDADVFRSTLEILDMATGSVTVILTMPALQVLLAPRWSADGERVVVEVIHLPEPSLEVEPDGGGIGVVDLTAAKPVVAMIIPLTPLWTQSPDWSPDGTRLVYAKPSAADPTKLDLHVSAPDGTGDRRLTDLAAEGASAIQPAYAPDGQRILFLLTRAGKQETDMAMIDLDGTNLRPATPNGYQDGFHPRLRPLP